MATKILFAGQSAAIQEAASHESVRHQVEVVCASDAAAAERLLKESAPDLLLAEMALPDKSGIELCEQVREEPGFRLLPIALLDSTFDPFHQWLAQQAGADAYLVVPLKAWELEELLGGLGHSVGGSNPEPGEAISQTGANMSSAPRGEEAGAERPEAPGINSGAADEPERTRGSLDAQPLLKEGDDEPLSAVDLTDRSLVQQAQSYDRAERIGLATVGVAILITLGFVALQSTYLSEPPTDAPPAAEPPRQSPPPGEQAQPAPARIGQQQADASSGEQPAEGATGGTASAAEANHSPGTEGVKGNSRRPGTQAAARREHRAHTASTFRARTSTSGAARQRDASKVAVVRSPEEPMAHSQPTARHEIVRVVDPTPAGSRVRGTSKPGQKDDRADRDSKDFGTSVRQAAVWSGRKIGQGFRGLRKGIKRLF
ncbi:MAG TPA: response regulator [Caldilineaceae bacterium]|nr:response regulator [Caldilineaceae bacterium]